MLTPKGLLLFFQMAGKENSETDSLLTKGLDVQCVELQEIKCTIQYI